MTGNRSYAYSLMLLATAAIWGSSLFLVKDVTESLPVNFLLAVRFLAASALVFIFFWSRVKTHLNRRHVLHGLILGMFLFFAYWFQTIGLTDTTPSKCAFLTSVYCVLVPVIVWIVDRVRPNRYNLIAAVIMVAGIGFISLSSGLTMRFGDAMSLIGALFCALQVFYTARFSADDDPIVLAAYQMAMAGVLGTAFSMFTDSPPTPTTWSLSVWLSLVYLIVMCSFVCYLFENIGQKHVSPQAAAILLSLTSVFGTLFSIIFYGDVLTLRVVVGFALVFCAVIISETKLSFLRRTDGGKN